MTGRAAIVQLARLLGKEEFYRRLSLDVGAEPLALDDKRLAALRSLVDERLEALTQALAAEAVANDDVVDGASAQAYLADRLATFGELLTEEQCQLVRERFQGVASGWG